MAVRNLATVQWLQGSPTAVESRPGRIGPISLGAKQTGERSAGNPHAAFDEAGAGNVAWSRWCDTRRRKGETTGSTNFELHRRASPRPYLMGRNWRRAQPQGPAPRQFLTRQLFFKWIKQHLRIKAFFGNSENAVKTANLDRRLCLRPGRHREKAPRLPAQPLRNSTDSQPHPVRKNPGQWLV